MAEETQQPTVTFAQRLVYWALRMVAFALNCLPLRIALAFASIIGRIWFLIDRKHRRRMVVDIARSLSLSEAEAYAIAKRVHAHFGMAAIEFLRFDKMKPEELYARVEYDRDQIEMYMKTIKERGAIYITGHIGSWELAGGWTVHQGWMRGAIARPLKNPLLNQWLRQKREALGMEIWDQEGAILRAMKIVKGKEAFAMLADQDGGGKGIIVPFFGRLASTMSMGCDLAMRCNAPMFVGAVLREGPMRYRLVIEDMLEPNPEADPKEERIRLATEMNRCLEAFIRKAPEQWIWFHHRWRTVERMEAARAKEMAAEEK